MKELEGQVCDLANQCLRGSGVSLSPKEKDDLAKVMVPRMRASFDETMRRDPHLDALKDPNEARGMIAKQRAALKSFRCLDKTSDLDLEDRVEKWAASIEAGIAEEQKCRASDECRAGRIAGQICATIADKRDAQQQLANERRNPGGVVDLAFLHDVGERIQIDDGQITSLKRDYASLAKKPFSGVCAP